MDAGDADWNEIWVLNNQVQQGKSLVLTDEVRALLRRTAPTVAISETEADAALGSVEAATALLQKIEGRIRDGSHRLSQALHRMYNLRDARDFEGARQQMRELLAVEVVPHYRSIAKGQLRRLGEAE
jgi:DUSAM domain-containing protein